MRMIMKSRPPCVPIVMAVMAALAVTAATTTTGRTTAWPTTETPGRSLNGKMFTLSRDGGISFSSPYYSPTTTPPYTKPTTRPTTPWTTAPATRGVSVCLRYLADDLSTLLTLSPSGRSPLQLRANNDGSYFLIFRLVRSDTLNFRPNLKFWSNIGPDIWTRICLTVDSMNNVAQMFSGPNISVRKMLPFQYVWSGEPVIDFSNFDSQLTDVQIWDYPLRYREVFNYMTRSVDAPSRGSALSWSDIRYSRRGQTLLEDSYETVNQQPGWGGIDF